MIFHFFFHLLFHLFKFFTKLFFSNRENIVRWLWRRTLHSLNSIFYVEFQATTFFFKYNRNYALESHLLSYDSTCEKQLIIIYSFADLEKNMILWWVVFSLRYIVKFGSRKIFGDNKFLISIVFKKWSNRNNLNTTRWLKSVFKVLRVFMNLKLIPPPPPLLLKHYTSIMQFCVLWNDFERSKISKFKILHVKSKYLKKKMQLFDIGENCHF